MTGVDGGHDIDLRRLAAEGVVLVGRVIAAENGRLAIADDLRSSIAHGDESLKAFNRRCDEVVRKQGLDLRRPIRPTTRADPPELPAPVRTPDLARGGR